MASPPVTKTARLIAGALVLLILIVVGALLVPPYAANWRLQSYLNDLADDPGTGKNSPETVRSQVLNAAAGLGLPVHSEDVRVSFSQGTVSIDVLYIVHVDLAGYTIDLHFRPAAAN